METLVIEIILTIEIKLSGTIRTLDYFKEITQILLMFYLSLRYLINLLRLKKGGMNSTR